MSAIEKLLEVMAALRDPKSGCPWDLEQDFSTIAPYTIEEAYEVADAIRQQDMPGLKGELGDLLLQVVFHAQMAREQDLFDFDDVVNGITDKMTRRHPHVFGDSTERTVGAVEGSWEAIKEQERAGSEDGSALAGVATALPALKRAEKLGKRAARVGFDWPDTAGVRDKILEEIDEVFEAIGGREQQDIEEELGDLLFAVVNLSRHLKVDAEEALSKANFKFESRFREVERVVVDRGESMASNSLESLEHEWHQAKARLSRPD